MWEWLGKVISRIICWLLPENPNVGNAQGPDFFSIMDQAKQEREDARIYFNSVTDPDLIDHAIYLQDAAEKKFMYLIKTAKRNGITLSVPEMAESQLSYGFDVRG